MVNVRYSRFTVGEIDPLLLARNDTEGYSSGLEKARNVTILSEGGIIRRSGSQFINVVPGVLTRLMTPTITAPNGGVTTNINNFVDTTMTTTNNISTTNLYVVIQYDLGAGVFQNICIDTIGISLTAGSSNEFYIQVSPDNATWTNIDLLPLTTNDLTKRVIINNGNRYVRIVRVGTTDLGTAKVNLKHFHIYQQTNTVSKTRVIEFISNINQSYIFVVSDKNIAVYKNRAFQANISTVTSDTVAYDESKMDTLNWTRRGDTLILFHEDVPPHYIIRMGSDTSWGFYRIKFDYIPLYDFTRTVTNPVANITPSATNGKITLSTMAAIFDASYENQVIEGNGGRVRITKYISAMSVEAIVEIPFYNTNVINSPNWDLIKGWEVVWSDTRGWPRSGAFYQERLWIGGSKSNPVTIWGSVIEDYYNFNPGSFRDTDAYDRDLESNDPIINMLAHQTLQVFTTGGEAAAIQTRGTALTPNTPGFMPQTKRGSAVGLRPLVAENAILFVQYGGGNISQSVFSLEQQSFTSSSLTLFSSHLMRTPVDFNLKRSVSTQEGNYLYIVNADGSMATCCYLSEQNVTGFTLWNTDGSYRNIGVDYNDVYLIVQRTINGINYKYIEVVDNRYLMDAAVRYTFGVPTSVLTGLSHLEGKSVTILVDGNVVPSQVVIGGQITLSSPAQTRAQVGLNFTPLVKTLPYENLQLVGEQIGNPKRVQESYIWIYRTGEVFVNDYLVSLKDFGGIGVGPLDAAAPLRDGLYRLSGLDGWDDYGQLTITQQNPFPMTILAIGMRVTV